VIRHAAEALLAHAELLQPVGDSLLIAQALDGLPHLPAVPGGAERQDSVRAGLEALAAHKPDIVLVHDAARPNIQAGITESVLAALEAHEGAIPAIPVSDTLKRGESGIITATIPRNNLFRAQTPQGFRFQTLLRLHRAATGSPAATDDAALLEAAGFSVALTPGAEQNIKLTLPEDYVRLQSIFEGRLIPRIGTGFDVHAIEAGRKMILCGITVPFEKGLAGHSDADVGIHALCDAIYGALAEGDIGRHFPPSEDSWKDADSARFLRHAAGRIAARGGILSNADVTLICERPKITPHAPAMRARLAELLNVSIDRISVKATTTEQLGFTGRSEGIAAQAAVVILVPG
jgi:2-C-methyl-D-erythritol 4-phosphate cytidylyltransferase/2-C-methyl-D-erythritol 2,4-cyclodiphosphate synthase